MYLLIVYLYYFKKDDNVDDIIKLFVDKDISVDNFMLVDYDAKLNVFTEIPTCIRLALISTLEIITILNNEILKIHMKIQDHHKRWLSYIYSIKIEDEMKTIIEHNIIFEKRLDLLFKILNV